MQQAMANSIRALSMDAIEAAASGHPGMPMGCADVATVLFTKFLKFDALAPNWPDRDRFVLSAGHGSMLLYSCLHLLGYEDISLDEIKKFRQLGAKTAGHPEYGHAGGIETTTGPLGQGIANAVGMAMAEQIMAAQFGSELVDHHTYVIAGDGCLMEGLSHEAISLAGHLQLSKLVVLFDDNGISIDGPLSLSESGDQIARFQAAGWETMAIDGHDFAAIEAALAASQNSKKPTLIACRTTIGYGAPKKQGTSAAHGSPLGAEEIAGARAALGINYGPFEVPSAIRDAWRLAGLSGKPARKAWEARFDDFDPAKRAEFNRRLGGELPENFAPAMAELKTRHIKEKTKVASRKASEMALEVINQVLPETIGGSADLTGSNNTCSSDMMAIEPGNFSGRYVHYGIREHAMAAAMNGMALHGGIIPYGGTFLVFADYSRPSIRLAALMGIRVIHVMTHDSIGLGEDGPTHQPVEHLAALRAIPNLYVLRPADAVETAECWEVALGRQEGPSVLALSRQGLEPVRTQERDENCVAKGAYELIEAQGEAKVSLFASGSEVGVAVAAQALLAQKNIPARVVSVPCFEAFAAQSNDYRQEVLGAAPVRIAIEAGIEMGWARFIGDAGAFVGMTGFGASAPINDLYEHFGITAPAVVAKAVELLKK
ncbi:MAG: transketolase [Alphaproteobacteria bacterium]